MNIKYLINRFPIGVKSSRWIWHIKKSWDGIRFKFDNPILTMQLKLTFFKVDLNSKIYNYNDYKLLLGRYLTKYN